MIPLFLAAGGDWTSETENALEFEDGCDAIEYSQKQHVATAEIYYHFDDPHYDFSIPLEGQSKV